MPISSICAFFNLVPEVLLDKNVLLSKLFQAKMKEKGAFSGVTASEAL